MNFETRLDMSEYQKMTNLYLDLIKHIKSGLVSEEWLKDYIQDKFVVFSNLHKIHLGINHVNSLLLGDVFNGDVSGPVEQKIYTMRALISDHYNDFLTYYLRSTGEEMNDRMERTLLSDNIEVTVESKDKKYGYRFYLHQIPPIDLR